MSYAIIRNSNYKKENLAGLYKHNERKNTNYSNKDINKEKSIKNYSIKECNTTYSKAINNLIEKHNFKCRVTKQTNLLCEFIITSNKEFFDNIGEEEMKRYFRTAYDFVAEYQNLGEEFIVSAKVHLDESTPHLHIVFVPVIHKFDIKSGKEITKIACSEYWKGKDSYKRLQDNFYKYITERGFDLERGKNNKVEHLTTEKLKQVTNYENIKCELEKEPVQKIDNSNMQMIIAQNQSLQAYTKKLRYYLAKSIKSIEQVEELKEQNQQLLNENNQLHKENNFLKKYIDNTYEYISILINIPKTSIKNMINNFFREIKEKEGEH